MICENKSHLDITKSLRIIHIYTRLFTISKISFKIGLTKDAVVVVFCEQMCKVSPVHNVY
jgi:hypothetical protein